VVNAKDISFRQDQRRVSKTFDWEAMNRLHAKGFTSNPVGNAKSEVLTDSGLAASRRLAQVLFGKDGAK
jgi:hypothetical protein